VVRRVHCQRASRQAVAAVSLQRRLHHQQRFADGRWTVRCPKLAAE
jgi:hypothetical protein